MKTLKTVLIVLFSFAVGLAFSLPARAQEEAPLETYPYEAGEVPPGMEVIAVTGGYKLIVPKGSKIKKVGAQIIVEGQREYLSRRLEEMENRFLKIEETLESLKKEVETLRGEKTQVNENQEALHSSQLIK